MQAVFTLALFLNAWACGASAATINPVSPLRPTPAAALLARRLDVVQMRAETRLRRSPATLRRQAEAEEAGTSPHQRH
jgi:hypothetical protein